MTYVIITPAKNEEKYIELTIKSICKQTLKPSQWIIVNDGSIDNTSKIVRNYMKKNKWIKLINYEDEEHGRKGGAKIIKVFYEGYKSIKVSNYDFLVKVDADLTLPENYFENVANGFEENPHVGLCGGYCVVERAGKLIREKSAQYHLRGSIKSYRKTCFDDIGGIKPIYNWDGLDEMTAMQRGWSIKIFPLPVIHHRPTSSEINRGLKNSYKAGVENYSDGNTLVLSFLRSISYGLRTKPRILTTFSFIFGFLCACIMRQNKHVDKKLEKFIKSFQYNRIKNSLSAIMRIK